MVFQQEPICAVATPAGVGALGIIRVSGAGAIALTNGIFSGKDLTKVDSHTVHFGTIRADNAANPIIDEVLVSIFKSPRSFTKEDVVEISCHGSDYIIRQILQVLVKNGARLAKPGEFTQRAFLNGQFDLVQAEAVADLIAADSAAAHHSALTQLRGGFSKQLAALRQELIHFASLIELELDFGEEDVEFANRDDLKNLIAHLQSAIAPLIASFSHGNALKEGIPVAIIGAPNVGKSTLLNTLLNEEKAIVTPIAGTTRDIIEDILFIDGLKFRIIDTAGIRQTDDLVESMGIERSKRAMNQADVVVLIYDDATTLAAVSSLATDLEPTKKLIWVQNKIDQEDSNKLLINEIAPIFISAKTGVGIENLKSQITQLQINPSQTVVTNLRHYEHLLKTNQALTDALMGLENNITGDFLAQDIRLSLHHLGEITGQIVNDDLLANIFSKFCIGK
ncbi:MAG: tRNA uridine-5-carboxymethylaminomethyl(34) synthesis GTPase MnmE [Cytophagia bacterium]|nr:MAG: tRNA uridine-5-carboxymethylaminomethyl(34) synthesis GTPase MnmE [Runella sp.]TAG18678.1 MAG: tRNA uridine-5-carboxymethylaminomethyl(34) synthesis GTPase MnmE [Cytophagales bacterium]TAG38228.1 MAG: tRNA uridine-5-carboxymethylaminomethyl(34) synthesis GTPase MnmE [Cytophagia bacterium]TAG73358.1 MAG: tRNA uridine-5-carboxymethylaminomethyl(34) synthesis GTPase MnmE [Runella slithyformis]TAG79610.1 MAG: tRNA uridine-5-carboxymethylaminomethyl(34) synthesis GTPase MnmE [Cytophagales ba